jgi:hypothetical protein
MTSRPSELTELVRQTAARVLRLLDDSQADRTAWDLKMELKVPNAVLFMSLGVLVAEGAVEVEPQELTYRVRRNVPAPVPGQS